MMNKTTRILIGVLALLALVAGTSLATKGGKGDEHRSQVAASHQPQTHEPGESAEPEAKNDEQSEEGGTPSRELLDSIVQRLTDAGIETDADTVGALAAEYGVGGAVRLLMWADASGQSAADLGALFDSGMGWGTIAAQLNDDDPEGDLELHPGIGQVMSGGHGPETAPGLNKP